MSHGLIKNGFQMDIKCAYSTASLYYIIYKRRHDLQYECTFRRFQIVHLFNRCFKLLTSGYLRLQSRQASSLNFTPKLLGKTNKVQHTLKTRNLNLTVGNQSQFAERRWYKLQNISSFTKKQDSGSQRVSFSSP